MVLGWAFRSLLCGSYRVVSRLISSLFFFFNDTATTEIYTLSLHDALPISALLLRRLVDDLRPDAGRAAVRGWRRSEEHTSELQSLRHLVCRLLLEKKKRRAQRE